MCYMGLARGCAPSNPARTKALRRAGCGPAGERRAVPGVRERTVDHGRQALARSSACAPVLRMTAAADRAGLLLQASRKGWLAIHDEREAPLVAVRGRAGAVFGYGDAMLAAGDELNPDRERRQDAPRRVGSRGAQRPLASPNVRTLGRLAPTTQPVTGASRPRDAAVPPARFCSRLGIVRRPSHLRRRSLRCPLAPRDRCGRRRSRSPDRFVFEEEAIEWRGWRLARSGSGIVGQMPIWSARGAGVKADSPPVAGRASASALTPESTRGR